MSEKINITLPSGVILEGVPADATADEIRDKAIRNGLASDSDFKVSSAIQESVDAEGVEGFLSKNMDIPLGMAGSALGGAAGFALGGPPGLFIGGTLGGAAGTYAGSLYSDDLQGEELDYAKAVEDAAWSMGFDLGTLGLGKIFRPAWVSGKKILGFSPEEVAEQLLKEAPEVGTKESLAASQKILSERGATLTPQQVGAEGWLNKIQEQFAQVGLFSSGVIERNANQVNEIVRNEISEVATKAAASDLGADQIANALIDVVYAGKGFLQQNYGTAWQEIVKKSAGDSYTVNPYIDTLNRFVQERQGQVVNSLSDDTIKYIEGLRETLSAGRNARIGIDEVSVIEKRIGNDLSAKFGNPKSPAYNDIVDRELTLLSEEIKSTTQKMLASKNPEAASLHRAMNDAYSKGRKGLFPEINKIFVQQASRSSYSALGKLIGKAGNVDQIIAFQQSLAKAFSEAAKSGQETVSGLTKKEADGLIRKGFLQTQFPDLTAGTFDIKKYANSRLAQRLADKTESRRWKAVLGEDYGRVKQLANLMSEASARSASNIGELVLRSKEYAAVGQGVSALAAVAGGTTAGVPGIGLMGAAAVLGIPVFMAKVTTNPKHVNKLIAFDKAKFKTDAAREAAFAVIVSDVLDAMSEEEQAELRNALRDAGQTPPEQEKAA